jgi:hypothetical protein
MFAEVPEPAYPPEIEPDRQGDSADEQIRDFYRVGVVASRRQETGSYEGDAGYDEGDPSGKDATDQSADQQPDPQLVTACRVWSRGQSMNSQEHKPPHRNTIPRCDHKGKTVLSVPLLLLRSD